MEEREEVAETATSAQVADAALRFLDSEQMPVEAQARTTNGTTAQVSATNNHDETNAGKSHGPGGSAGGSAGADSGEESAMAVDPKDSDAAADGLLRLKESSPRTRRSPPKTQSGSDGFGSNGSLATSANLRKFTISTSEGSPLETLPAMHATPSHSSAAKSLNGEVNLPSLVAQLGTLADGPVKDPDTRTNGLPAHGRQSFSSAGGVPGQSPPMASGAQDRRLPNQYINTQQRQTGPYQLHYPPTQTSPGSVYSEASPRHTFSHSQEPANMSPPGKPPYHPYYANRRPSQNDEHGPPYAPAPPGENKYTPSSIDGNPSSDNYTTSSDATLNEHHMSIDVPRPPAELPMQPPNGPLVSTGFKCDYPGCPAPAFQTQYLLK